MLSTQYSFLPFLHSPSPIPQTLTDVATTFLFSHHPTPALLSPGTEEWWPLCHVCPSCILPLHLCSSPASGVVSVLVLQGHATTVHQLNVLQFLIGVSQPRMQQDFFTKTRSRGAQPYLFHGFASACAPSDLDSEAGLSESNSVTDILPFNADVPCSKPKSNSWAKLERWMRPTITSYVQKLKSYILVP